MKNRSVHTEDGGDKKLEGSLPSRAHSLVDEKDGRNGEKESK